MSSSDKIAVFVDGAYLCATAKALGFDIDYKRLAMLDSEAEALTRKAIDMALAGDTVALKRWTNSGIFLRSICILHGRLSIIPTARWLSGPDRWIDCSQLQI
jgi:hypothetical protein